MSDAPPIIPKEKLSAYERWEMASFSPAGPATGAAAAIAAARAAAASAAAARPTAGVRGDGRASKPDPAIKLPTIDEIEQIHQEAQRAGYAAGYEEGTARTRMEAMRLHTVVESFGQSMAELDGQVAQELLTLALELSRQIVRQALEVKPEVILDVVREALTQLPHQHASIYLHPEDASLVRSYLGDQLSHAGHRIFEEPQISRGGCRIEAAGSQIDASMEIRWQRLLESLGQGQSWIERSEP